MTDACTGTAEPIPYSATRRAAARPHGRGGGLIAAVALAVICGREGFVALPGAGCLPGFAEGQPIRVGMNITSSASDCRVARVLDGDTLDLHCPGEGAVRARLLGFDTPEAFSPQCALELALGSAATRALERNINASREIQVVFRGTDRYGRRLARLSLDGADVAGLMVAEGLARHYEGGRRPSWCG